MAKWKNIYLDNQIHFFTASVVDRVPLFTDIEICRLTLDVWDQLRSDRGFKIIGYVLMPDHIHLMTHFDTATECERFHRDSNRLIAKLVIVQLQKTGLHTQWLQRFEKNARSGSRFRVWAPDPRVVPIGNREMAKQRLNYIHLNPVRKQFVDNPIDWKWSSCGAYYGEGESPIRVDMDSFPMF